MVDFNVTTYVNANKITCAINCIKNYLWEGIPFDNSLKKIAEAEPNFPHYYNKRLSAATKKELEKSSCDLEYLKKILNKDRKTYVYPSYNNLKDYIKNSFETDLTIQEIQGIIRDNLLSMENEVDQAQPNIEDDVDIEINEYDIEMGGNY